MRPSLVLAISWVALFTMGGCASYQTKVGKAREELRNGRAEAAVKLLEPHALKEGDDQLVYLLDYAIALQMAGRIAESTQAFLKAADIAEIKDYHSLSRVTGSLLLNEGMVQYKGEDYEKLLIHVFLAMNFLLQNDLEGALVETRRIDEKLTKYRVEAKREYEQNTFARYLAAVIWEADKKWDDAYIDYKSVYELHSDIELLKADLLRTSKLARRWEDHAKWKNVFDNATFEIPNPRTHGEVVLIYQQGRAPVKRPNPDSPRFPKLFAVPSVTKRARLELDSGLSTTTEPIYSIEDTAIKTLNDAYGALVAKRITGIVAKEVVADQIRQKDELLGAIAWIGMHISDQADLRQWSTLPGSLQIARLAVPAGNYTVRVQGLTNSLQPTSERMQERSIEVQTGKKTFVIWRSFD